MPKAKQLKRVLIMAGGTGGHVFPGLALARYLKDKGIEVHWLGTALGIESHLVPEAGMPLHLITIHGVRGKGITTLAKAPFKILVAIIQTMRIIRTLKPDVIVGMGGFASGPGGVASWLLGYPLIIHEQNARAGLTNQWLARFAKYTLQGFPGAFSLLGRKKHLVTLGNPVRTEIGNLPSPSVRFSVPRSPFHLLVLGGSLGAAALNELVPKALSILPEAERPIVWHQTGDKHLPTTKNIYETKGLSAKVQPFIQDMASAYSWADIVLCRAGALTIAELCTVGLGAILVPYPYAVDDHQTANAAFMVKHQAALCIKQSELTETYLAEMIKTFASSPEKRLAMAEAAYQIRSTQVVEKMFDILSDLVSSKV